jgi:NTP pyrophosphatase (non-canonical NTP hydrolase)
VEIQEIIHVAHETAKEKGWYDEERAVGELIALMHSELSEALEHYREGMPIEEIFYTGDDGLKPDGFTVELADCIIRICQMAGKFDLPLEVALFEKLAYNKTRPYKHGGKKI